MPRLSDPGVKTATSSTTEKADGKTGTEATQMSTGNAPTSEQSREDPQQGPSQQLEVQDEAWPVYDQPNGKFELIFYMKHFRASDIIVKVIDRHVIIDASHKMHVDEHGFVKRSMFRKHALPESVAVDDLTCCFTGNGYLIVQDLVKNTESQDSNREVLAG